MTRNHIQAALLTLGAILILCCHARGERPFSEVLAEARSQVQGLKSAHPDAAVPSRSNGEAALPAVVASAASGSTQALRDRIATFKANGGRQWYQRSGNGYVTSLEGIRRHLRESHEYPPGADGLNADELAWLHGTYHEPEKLAARTVQRNTQWVQRRVCRNGVCRLEWVQVQ